jgi:hypothetical protein
VTDKTPKPTDDTAAEDQTPVSVRVVVARDPLGNPVETVEVDDPRAVAHWDDDAWRPLR